MRRLLSSAWFLALGVGVSCGTSDSSAPGNDGGPGIDGSSGSSSGDSSLASSSSSSSSSGGGPDANGVTLDASLADASADGPIDAGRDGAVDGGAGDSGSADGAAADAGPAGPCTWGTAFNGNASFTWYYFGQGPGSSPYKSACGYSVTEPSKNGQGTMDTASNVANTAPANAMYFAAIPGASSASGFETVGNCGSCIEITGQNGTKIIATIIDECPIDTNSACAPAGHLDLSTQAFDQLGYQNGSPSGTTWKFVPCPIEKTSSIVAVQNSGGQYYFQNSVYPISSVDGQKITTAGFFNVNPGPVTIVSDVAGQTIQGNLPGGGGPINAQFTGASNCY